MTPRTPHPTLRRPASRSPLPRRPPRGLQQQSPRQGLRSSTAAKSSSRPPARARRDGRLRGRPRRGLDILGRGSPVKSRFTCGSSPTRVRATAPAARRPPREIRSRSSKSCGRSSAHGDTRLLISSSGIPWADVHGALREITSRRGGRRGPRRPAPPRFPRHLRGGPIWTTAASRNRSSRCRGPARSPNTTRSPRPPTRSGAAGQFGSYPVRVLTATSHPVSAGTGGAVGGDARLARRMRQSTVTRVIVQGAGHHIQIDRPDVVVVSTILAALPPTSP